MSTDEPHDAWSGLWPALGRLVVSSGQLEETVRDVVLNMMGGPHWKRTELVISGFMARQVRDCAVRLAYEVLAGPLQDDVVDWIKQVEAAQTLRNNVIHSSWATIVLTADGPIGPAAMSSKVHKPKEGLRRKAKAWTPGEIDDVTDQVSRAHIRGVSLTVELQSFSLAEARDTPDSAPWSR